jgi:hypothetical protein
MIKKLFLYPIIFTIWLLSSTIIPEIVLIIAFIYLAIIILYKINKLPENLKNQGTKLAGKNSKLIKNSIIIFFSIIFSVNNINSSTRDKLNKSIQENKKQETKRLEQEKIEQEKKEKEYNQDVERVKKEYEKNSDKALQAFLNLASITSLNKYLDSVSYLDNSINYCSGKITVNNQWHYEPKQIRLQLAQDIDLLWFNVMKQFKFIIPKKDFCKIEIVDINNNKIGGSNNLAPGVYVDN